MRFEIEEITLGQLPSGDDLTSRLFRFREGNGRKAWLQANVHGGEVQGNLVILELLERLSDLTIHGEIALLPMANPLGLTQAATSSGRYDLTTGLNFNREYQLPFEVPAGEDDWRIDIDAFARNHLASDDAEIFDDFRHDLREAWVRFAEQAETAEHRFVAELQSRSCDADLFLDLHTGDRSPRYLFVFDSNVEGARYLGSPHNLLMEDSKFGGAGDEAHFHPWYALREALAAYDRRVTIPVESFTVELGPLDQLDEESASRAADDIVNYLTYHGIVDGEAELREMRRYACRQEDYISIKAPAGGLVSWQKEPGDHVRKGEVVAELISFREIENLATISRARTLLTAPADAIILNQHHHAMVSRGTTLFKLMTNVNEL